MTTTPDLSPQRLRALLEAAEGPAAPSELFYLAPDLARRVVEQAELLTRAREALVRFANAISCGEAAVNAGLITGGMDNWTPQFDAQVRSYPMASDFARAVLVAAEIEAKSEESL